MSDPLDRIAFVSAVDVPPNAVIVVRSALRLKITQVEEIQRVVGDAFPGRRVLVLPPDLELDVVCETAA